MATMHSATHHAMPPEFGRKWRKFTLPTLLCDEAEREADFKTLTNLYYVKNKIAIYL